MLKEIVAFDMKVTEHYKRCPHLKPGGYAPFLIATYIGSELISCEYCCKDCYVNDKDLMNTAPTYCQHCGDVVEEQLPGNFRDDVCTSCSEPLRMQEMGLTDFSNDTYWPDPDEPY